jgi:hypothetical protein
MKVKVMMISLMEHQAGNYRQAAVKVIVAVVTSLL